MGSRKNDTNEFYSQNRNGLRDTEVIFMVTKWERVRINLKFEINIHTSLYINQRKLCLGFDLLVAL